MNAIPELGALAASRSNESNKKRKFDLPVDLSEEGSDDDGITFNNPPCMTWIHTDHDEKVDIVNVAVPVISGSENVDFGLSEDGMQLIIEYNWPKAMYVPALLFCKKVDTMPMTHPKVHALSSELMTRGYMQKSKPAGNIVVPLPVKVQR